MLTLGLFFATSNLYTDPTGRMTVAQEFAFAQPYLNAAAIVPGNSLYQTKIAALADLPSVNAAASLVNLNYNPGNGAPPRPGRLAIGALGNVDAGKVWSGLYFEQAVADKNPANPIFANKGPNANATVAQVAEIAARVTAINTAAVNPNFNGNLVAAGGNFADYVSLKKTLADIVLGEEVAAWDETSKEIDSANADLSNLPVAVRKEIRAKAKAAYDSVDAATKARLDTIVKLADSKRKFDDFVNFNDDLQIGASTGDKAVDAYLSTLKPRVANALRAILKGKLGKPEVEAPKSGLARWQELTADDKAKTDAKKGLTDVEQVAFDNIVTLLNGVTDEKDVLSKFGAAANGTALYETYKKFTQAPKVEQPKGKEVSEEGRKRKTSKAAARAAKKVKTTVKPYKLAL